jgi:hypothetical protein
MHSLSCCQLDWVCTHYLPKQCTFLGVHPADSLPSRSTISGTIGPLAFIVNSDPGHMPGTHWLAFYRASSTSDLEYFDSFGHELKTYNLIYKHKDFPTCIRVNHVQLQANNTVTCGYFALYYILQRCKLNKIKQIISLLYHCKPFADNFIRLYFKKHVKVPTSTTSHCKFCCNQCSRVHSLIT